MDDQHFIIKALRYGTKTQEFTFIDLCNNLDFIKGQGSPKENAKRINDLIGYRGNNPEDNGSIKYENSYKALFLSDQIIKNKLYDCGNYFDAATYASKLSASIDDHMRLLEYTELKEAREDSKTAKKFAQAAQVTAICALAVSIYFSNESYNLTERAMLSTIKLPTEFSTSIDQIQSNTSELAHINKQYLDGLTAKIDRLDSTTANTVLAVEAVSRSLAKLKTNEADTRIKQQQQVSLD